MKTPAAAVPRIILPKGFLFSGVAAGIKISGAPDLALAEAPAGASAAAMFTNNRVVAAPVVAGRKHLQMTGGRVQALIVNSGNANCATGKPGWRAVVKTCYAVAAAVQCHPAEVFPSSTGVIGVQLPVEKITRALPALVRTREDHEAGADRFARAIMTTDTRLKAASAMIRCGGSTVTLMGVAKGAGMIHPRLATMLVYLFTDAAATPAQLRPLLRAACRESFNHISIDGDTSTNDTVLLLASGASGQKIAGGRARAQFGAALSAVCASLARQIVADGEGVQHVVKLRIENARSPGEAEQVARAIANSALVKTAWAGADPNWGRVLAAVGYSGVPIDPASVDIFFGPHRVCRKGELSPFDENTVHSYLSQPEFEVRVRLGRGKSSTTFWTCDLTQEYIKVNADYRT